jgi:hypothetical protein
MSLTATNAQVYKGTAAVTYKGAPTSNTALSLSGAAGNYILFPATHPTNFSPATSNVFIEAWVYWNNSVWTSSTGGGIYERENVGNTVQDFGMYTNSSGQLTAYMYTQNGSILRPIFNTALNVQQWYHVAFGYNTVNQTAYIWVNGSVGTTSTASNPARYTVTQTYIGFNPINMPSVYAWNGYIQDLRVFQGGVIPTTSFTPASASFGLANPTYVTGGTIVLSLATQYFQTNMKVTSGGSIQLYSRPVQTAVLVNPGSQTFLSTGTVTVQQTALQPANGITWAVAPTGSGLSIASSTDYALTLTASSANGQFTVSATNKQGFTTVTQFNISSPKATGGSITSVGGSFIHTFTSTGTTTFTVNNPITSAQVLVVAGGGAGGAWSAGGGGGAGGLIYVGTISLAAGSYTVTVGSGGTAPSGSGQNSVFSTYTAIGGGGGATNGVGITGGSGGGSQSTNPAAIGGSGTAGQGNSGGVASIVSPAFGGGGGGGASAAGQNGSGTYGGKGGDGIQYSISGSPVYYAGGGGGTYTSSGTDGLGGLGGGGKAVFAGPGVDGTPNTGGGGGASGVIGGSGSTRAGAGGSGIVIISYVS